MIPEASVAAVIRAWRDLGASTDEERREIARLLNFDLRDPDAPTVTPPAQGDSKTSAPTVPTIGRRDSGHQTTNVAADAATAVELVPFPDVVDSRRAFSAKRVALPTAAAPTPLESLFAPNWTRAISSSVVSRRADVGPPDMVRLAAMVARLEPVLRLPRLPRRISATEVIAAIDGSGTMPWFRADAEQLVSRLDAVTRAPVTVVRCHGAPELAPATGAPDEDGDSAPLVHVSAGGRIIAITDLGLGSIWSRPDVRRARAWCALASEVVGRGASLVIVTPVPLAEIPDEVRRTVICVHWDRRTRPAFVHRLLRACR